MVRFLVTTSLVISWLCSALAFSVVKQQRPSTLLTWTTQRPRLTSIIRQGAGDTDYDTWYDDFDPSTFEARDDKPSFPIRRNYDNNNNNYNGSAGGGGKHDYVRDWDADRSNVNEQAVNALISERLQCRKTRRFDEADAIRDELLRDHGVRVLDREKTWRSGCSASGSRRQWGNNNKAAGPRNPQQQGRQQSNRKPRDFGPLGHDYELSADAGPNVSQLPESEIHARIAERLACKMNRQFPTADAIQAELEDLGVYIHDGRKEWRSDGEPYGDYQSGNQRGPGRTVGSVNDRNRPYTQASDSEETEYVEQIQSLVDERSQAKQARSFQVADDIRDDLRELYNVQVNDKLRQWSVGGNFGQVIRAKSSFVRAPWSDVPDDNADEIQSLVEQRDAARKVRDFATADEIRDKLQSMNVQVDDKRREWSIGQGRQQQQGVNEFGLKAFTRRGGGSLTPAQVDKITGLLEKRDQAKRNRQFGKADSIRDELRENFFVRIDDRSREWKVVTDEFVMAPEIPIPEETKNLIESKISERSVAKLNKDYETADAIRDELSQVYAVYIDDRVREWRIEGEFTEPVDEMDNYSDDSDEEEPSFLGEGQHAQEEDDNGPMFFAASNEAGETNETDFDELQTEMEGVFVDDESTDQDDLESLKVDELKERLRAAGLPVSGKKAELIERLSSI